MKTNVKTYVAFVILLLLATVSCDEDQPDNEEDMIKNHAQGEQKDVPHLDTDENKVPTYGERTGLRAHPDFILFLFGGLAVGTLVRTIMAAFNIPLPYPIAMLLLGAVLAVFSNYYILVADFLGVIDIQPRFVFFVIIPILVFKVGFCIDAHVFLRAWLQIALISIPGLLINAVFIGFLVMIIIQIKWSYATAVLFGTICTPIYPAEVVTLLKEIGLQKQIIALLEGESIVGIGVVIIVFEVIFGWEDLYVVYWYHFISVIVRFAGGGILFGFLAGKLSSFLINRLLFNDAIIVISTTLVSTFMTYYIGEFVLSVSGTISVATLGVMLSIERASLRVDVEQLLINFWEMVAFLINTPVFIMFGVKTTGILIRHQLLNNFALMLVVYTLAIFGRFVAFILLAPILSRVGYGITFKQTAVCIWGGLHGVVSYCLAHLVHHHPQMHDVGHALMIHTLGIVFLTLVINATTMPLVLRLLGLSDLSMARKINMNNCMKYVLLRREKIINILKMNRFLADANWPMVNEVTVLKHPYKILLVDDDEDDDYYLGYRLTTCPDCQKEIPTEPTAKELAEMTKEARSRILKAKKISYGRQYENGMLSKEGVRILYQAVEIAMDTEEILIDLEGLHKLFQKQGFFNSATRKFVHFFMKKTDDDIKPPRKYWRRIAYKIVTKPAFEYVINVFILLNVIPIIIEEGPTQLSPMGVIYIKAANTFFFLVYLIEFLLKVYGYSWIYLWEHGIKTYFRSYWNIFDFALLLAALADLILDYVDAFTNFNKAESKASKITAAGKLVRIVRLIRLVRIFRDSYPKLLKWCESKIDTKMAFAYDVGKGFVNGETEVSDMLVQMIDNKTIREDMRQKMEADRLAVTKQLGLIQKDRPWIAITVKTKQAIRSTINSMLDAVNELKISGWVDEVEYAKLMESLDERLKRVGSIKSVQPSPPKVVFQEVPWMASDETIIEFLYENVHTKVFDPGDIVCAEGKTADGIFIIVTGLLKITYNPKKETLDRLAEYGELPVLDYISSSRFEQALEDYVVSGNCIGELAVLTGRPYSSTVTADTPSQVYVLTKDIIKRAMEKSPDPTAGLEARMWKCISVRLAAAILMDVPAYQLSTQEKIKYSLERAFVPNLKHFKLFSITDLVEDIILIEGVVVDFNTRDCYTAPVYIPRAVQRLILPKSSYMNLHTDVETRILVIPIKDAEAYEVMETGEEMSEMISTSSFRCLRHTIQNKAIKARRRKRTTFNVDLHAKQSHVSSHLSCTKTPVNNETSWANMDEKEIRNVSMTNEFTPSSKRASSVKKFRSERQK